jgi:hypothetical protein
MQQILMFEIAFSVKTTLLSPSSISITKLNGSSKLKKN